MSKQRTENRESKTESRKPRVENRLSAFGSRFSIFGFRFSVLCCLLSVLCSHCSTSFDNQGVYHRVREGENLFWVAKSYGIDLQDLAELNNIENTEGPIRKGQKLYIPPKRFYLNKKLPFEGRLTASLEPPKRKFGRKFYSKEKIRSEHDRFIWPVEGKLISPFGIRHGRRHDGIDIKAKQGTTVVAADNGRVVYAGTMRGYGNLILIRHKDNLFTAYAHNQVNLVKEENVKKGQTIGKVGRTGRATGSHLHFEVREGEKARNPLFFLPVMR